MKINEYKSIVYAKMATLQLAAAQIDSKIASYDHQYDIYSLLHVNKLLDKKAEIEDKITQLANSFNRTMNYQVRAYRDKLTPRGVE